MTVRPTNPETRQDAVGDNGTPRWVKVFGAISLVVVLLVVILLFTGGGGHGPSRHTGGDGPSRHTGGDGGDAVPSSVAEHTPTVDSHTP